MKKIILFFCLLFSLQLFGQKNKHPVEYQLFGEVGKAGIGIQSLGDSSISIMHNVAKRPSTFEVREKVLPVEELQYFKVRKKRNFLKGALIGMGVGFAVGYAAGRFNDGEGCSGYVCFTGHEGGMVMGAGGAFWGIFIGGFTAKSYIKVPVNGQQEIYEKYKDELMPYILNKNKN